MAGRLISGSINAQSEFQEYYGLGSDGGTSTGLMFSIYQIGQMVAACFYFIPDALGRRMGCFIGCVGVCVATVIISTAHNLPIFIFGRFLISFFGVIATQSGSILLAELAPSRIRGTFAGLYNTMYYLGSIVATFAVYGSNLHLQNRNHLSWRLPLWLQMLCPAITALGMAFVPESPRWLVARGRRENAKDILVKYHAFGDVDSPMVRIQMAEIEESLEQTRLAHWKSLFDLRILYSSRPRRWRSFLIICMAWFGQFSGNNVASYYLPMLLENVGITSTDKQLLLNAIYALSGWLFAMSGAYLHDLFGRRKMLLFSTTSMAICMAITGGTAAGYVQTGSKISSAASIAFIYIFGVCFAIAMTSMQTLYATEISTNDMRAKGAGFLNQIVSGCASFVNTFAAPVALNRVGWRVYIFFAFWDLFEASVVYAFFVETRGRTLEELEVIFDSKNPRKTSTRPIILSQQRGRDDEENPLSL